VAAVLAATPVLGRGADAPADAPKSKFLDATDIGKSKEPIVVTSDRLEYDYRGNVVVYKGGVQASPDLIKGRIHTMFEILPTQIAETLGLSDGIRAIPIVDPEAIHTIGLVVPTREPMTPLNVALVAEARRIAATLSQ